MNTIYNRNIWKKRSLFGYSPESVRQEIYELQDQHSMLKEKLQEKLAMKKMKYNEMNDYLEQLKKRFKEQGPVEIEMTQSLFEKLLETTAKVEVLKEEHQRELSRLDSAIQSKCAERAHLVEQLKETLQQLHTTFTSLGGMHHE